MCHQNNDATEAQAPVDAAVDRPGAGGPASLVDLAMPYLRHLDPHRVAAVKAALQHLQLMQRESVLLIMPEIAIPR